MRYYCRDAEVVDGLMIKFRRVSSEKIVSRETGSRKESHEPSISHELGCHASERQLVVCNDCAAKIIHRLKKM